MTDGQEMESPAKKLKSETTSFTEQNSTDDICLQFDDGMKLYAPPGFLFLTSPVFKAMFDHECVEKKTKTIKLKEKKYEDFLDFLMCLHPAHQRLVDQSNVLRIVRFASEYQVPSIESKCQAVMESWLSESVTKAKKECTYDRFGVFTSLKTCLVILNTADEIDYLDIKTKAIESVAHFGIGLYSKRSLHTTNYVYQGITQKSNALLNECKEMFDAMSDCCKSMVFFERLKLLENDEML